MGGIFKFKRFEVDQSGCAMKINTDGVLLGGLAIHANPSRILDIGTGTGVIALMLAQRFEQAWIDAVEIDESAAERAAANFNGAPFEDRLEVHCMDIAAFAPLQPYDLIVSNPPYFVNDLKNKEPRKILARHADEDFFDTLIRKIAGILSAEGCFWVILPIKQAGQLIVNAVLHRLFPSKIIHVYSDEQKPEFRQVICFTFNDGPAVHENLYIYLSEGTYTDAYRDLLKDFFLAF